MHEILALGEQGECANRKVDERLVHGQKPHRVQFASGDPHRSRPGTARLVIEPAHRVRLFPRGETRGCDFQDSQRMASRHGLGCSANSPQQDSFAASGRHARGIEGQPERSNEREQQTYDVAQASIGTLESLDADDQFGDITVEGDYVGGSTADPSPLCGCGYSVEQLAVASGTDSVANTVIVVVADRSGAGCLHGAVQSTSGRSVGQAGFVTVG